MVFIGFALTPTMSSFKPPTMALSYLCLANIFDGDNVNNECTSPFNFWFARHMMHCEQVKRVAGWH